MLSRSDNEVLTRVGAGTPMGELMRRYWIPALLSAELPKPNCDPLRLRLLGEDFVAWRDAAGQVAIFDERCPHRGASLALARCESDGLRCLYHGWKFAADGRIIDTPNISGTSIKDKIRATIYPVVETGEMIWVYLGPKDKQPELPQFAFMTTPPEHRLVRRTILDCNWLQSVEGHLDSSHAGILHRDWDPFGRGTDQKYMQLVRSNNGIATDDDIPTIESEDTIFGFHTAAVRNATQAGEEVKYARVHTFALPWLTIIPPASFFFEIPIDDEHVSIVSASWDPATPVNREHAFKIFGSPDMYDHWGGNLARRFKGTPENRWFQDRERMRVDNSFTGINGFIAEDLSVCASMGPIFDRSKEHLVAADSAVIRMRRLLLKAAKDLQKGTEPRVLSAKETARLGAKDGVLAPGRAWQELVPDQRDMAITPTPLKTA